MRLLVTFFVGSILIVGCRPPEPVATAAAQELPEILVDGQDWQREGHAFPEGHLYAYVGKHIDDEDFGRWEVGEVDNPDILIGYLLGQGISVEEAWYKPGANHCAPPGSDVHLTVIVEPAFVVRTAQEEDAQRMRSLGFEKQDEPGLGQCLYHVRHYQVLAR